MIKIGRSSSTIRKYEDRSNKKKNPYTDINGKYIAQSHRLGYCHNKIHTGFLNHKQIIEHECTKKNCPYFNKYEDHPFWIEKKKRKEAKKNDK